MDELRDGDAHDEGPVSQEAPTAAGLRDRDAVFDRLLERPGVVMLVGDMDTGKTTFALELLRRALGRGIPGALVDADIVLSTVGPPTTIGLKFCTGEEDLTREGLRGADALGFVGSVIPKGHLLPLTTSTGKLVNLAREAGYALIVVDTTSVVSGIYGQSLKFFKMDLVKPDFVVGFQRGAELELIIGIASRFTAAEVMTVPVGPAVEARSVEDRIALREEQFESYFSAGVSRWRVKPTVFMPTLPPEFDLSSLEGLLVGAEDGRGGCAGIGVLEHEPGEDILRMVSPVKSGVRGLRLGSMRVDVSGRSRGSVDLRQLLGSE